MNERIKELMLEANKNLRGKPFQPALEEFSEKFAQLIVERIIDNVECHASLFNTKEARQVCSWIIKSVKYDFGVPE